MAYYPQFPAIYAYPMPFPNQEFYGMYPPGSAPMPHPGHEAPAPGMYFGEAPHHPGMGGHSHGHRHHHNYGHKHGYNNRKESMDSGISDFSMASGTTRKTSNTSTISNSSIILEEPSSPKPEAEEAKESQEAAKEELPPMETPEDDLCEQIVKQVEFYFSDANITKDKFLLKHVKRNKEGFVSLKLISSFKRVKHLTKDWRQVAYAIERKSDLLEVNDLKTKVRRLDALPEYDETTPSRTVVALDLPLERPTIEGVAELFSTCGDIVLIRILRPGNPIPADIKPFVNKHPEMTAKVCALVEFEKTEFALKAVRELNTKEEETSENDESSSTDEEETEKKEEEEKEPKMKVMELTAPPPKTTKSKEEKKKAALKQQQPTMPTRRFSHAGFNLPPAHHQQGNPKAEQMMTGPRRRISLYHNMKFAPISEEQQKKEMSLNPNAPSFSMAGHPHHHHHHHVPQPVPHMHQRRLSRPPFVHPAHAMEMAAMNAAMNAAAMQGQFFAHQAAPWMAGRRMSHGMPDLAASGLGMPTNVARMPRGPDRGKGFQKWCRSRMEPAAPTPNPLPKKSSRAVPIVAPPAQPAAAPSPEPAVAEPEAAAAAVEAAVEEVVEGAAALAVAAPFEGAAALVPAISDSGDSGNEEDANFSDHDVEALENERAR